MRKLTVGINSNKTTCGSCVYRLIGDVTSKCTLFKSVERKSTNLSVDETGNDLRCLSCLKAEIKEDE